MRVARALLTCGLLLLGACGSDEGDGAHYPVWLVPDTDLLEGEPCGVDGPDCAEGTFCAVVNVATGETEPICVRQEICDEVSCMNGQGDCVVAESFPAQVFCSNDQT
jgi:hypothetical protein